MSSRSRLVVSMLAVVVALLVTGAALAVSGLTYDKTAQLSVNNTRATVTGLVTCAPTDVTVNVFVNLIQSKGRQLTIGSGSTNVACPVGGGTVSWTVVTQVAVGFAYQPGSATVSVSASGFTDSDEVSGPIRLKN